MPISGPQQTLQAALRHHQSGGLGEAERLYRQVLASQPNHPEALRNLGLLLHQTGRHDLAIEILRRAISVTPDAATAHNTLGEALRALGRLDEAVISYRHAVRLNDSYPEAHNNLGGALLQLGRADEGIRELLRAIELRPTYGRARLNLGNALAQTGRLDEAIEMLAAAAQMLPTFPPAHALRGDALLTAGRVDEAIESFGAAVKLDRNYSDALNGLGRALRRGRWTEALETHQAASRVRANDADALAGAADCFVAMNKYTDADAALRAAIALRPRHAPYHNELGEMYRKAGMIGSAIESFRRALEIDPKLGQVHNNLGFALSARGDHEEAVASLRRAVELSPENASIHGNLLMAMNYRPLNDPRAVFEAHAEWGKRHASSLDAPLHRSCAGDDPERPLRIGYVSPDLRHHPVAAFLEPLLASRDRSRFRVVAYSDTRRGDDVTQRLDALFDDWRDVNGLTDDAVAHQIVADRIDVLVDLAGHTARNRLTMFARRAAPVQMTYLGYPNTTGVPAIGYRLTDAIADPPGESDALHTEKLIRLPRCFLCYRPFHAAPAVVPPPAERGGPITFGVFNNYLKVSPDALRAWAEILRALPSSRLLIKTSGFNEPSTDQRVRESLAAQGVPLDRVELIGTVPAPADFLALYGRVDIALDTFPYNGTTTTCEALWMGVPVVAYVGETHASRVSASIMTSVRLPELIAPSRDGYIELAIALARDVPRLSSLRSTLRDRLRASPLLDGPGHARAVETAFRGAWRAACAGSVE